MLVNPLWRGRVFAQCWCGRKLLEVDYDTIRAGDTAICNYYRCPQIACMSPNRRLKLTPHHRASYTSKVAA